MSFFIETYLEIIKSLLNAKVDFIVIGGYSVIFHGYHRTTGDIDFFIKPDNNNKEKLINALRDFGINEKSLNELEKLDFSETHILKIGEPPERIEFLTKINVVSYAEADKEKIISDVDGLKIPFLHLNHLILSKINTGRAQDAADIEMLQKIQKKE